MTNFEKDADSSTSSATHIYENVQAYYGDVLKSSSDLKTTACCTLKGPPSRYLTEILKRIPKEVSEKYYGCGYPLPMGLKGCSVLDLGSGAGRDCFVLSALVGESGRVTGVDMTKSMMAVAERNAEEYCRKCLGYENVNMKFVHGYMEYLVDKAHGIVEESSQDLIISNCVLNLSPNKHQVLRGVYSALKQGGEFYFSDVYCSRRLPKEITQDPVLYGECLGGALYIEDFIRMARDVGFIDVRMLSKQPIDVTDETLKDLVGQAKFYSITFRCFKVDCETICEDYGQIATYLGGIPTQEHAYVLDNHHVFEKNKPARVCGNTANMVEKSWLKKYFTVQGDTSVHYGRFDCAVQPTISGDCCF